LSVELGLIVTILPVITAIFITNNWK
jgi:hypothetical protein